jgi:hypothetical protein
MSLDFLSCIKGFVAVAEYNGFSQAARYLQVSTPMLTNPAYRGSNIQLMAGHLRQMTLSSLFSDHHE